MLLQKHIEANGWKGDLTLHTTSVESHSTAVDALTQCNQAVEAAVAALVIRLTQIQKEATDERRNRG